MSSFDDREKGFENKFAHDEELEFKATARRNKLLGLWLAEKFGLSGADADAYAKDVVASDFEEAGHEDVVRKVMADITARGVAVTEHMVRTEMDRLMAVARDQIKNQG